jgi:membrane protease YdiL (CAAX protease family)
VTLDSLYLAIIAIAIVVDYFVVWPMFLRRSQADAARARLWLWSAWMILLWTQVAVGIALWLFKARAWELLRFIIPHGWRLWLAIGLVLAVTIVYAPTALRLARSQRRKRIKIVNPAAARLSPRTRSEMGWWVALALSAGFCEEFVFRGYLIWVFQAVIGWWGAAAISVVLFGLAHAYQGAKGILATGVVGFLFTLVVLIYGSLWPAIASHALVDIGEGLIAWLALRRIESESRTAPA